MFGKIRIVSFTYVNLSISKVSERTFGSISASFKIFKIKFRQNLFFNMKLFTVFLREAKRVFTIFKTYHVMQRTKEFSLIN